MTFPVTVMQTPYYAPNMKGLTMQVSCL